MRLAVDIECKLDENEVHRRVTVEADVTLDADGDYQFSNLATLCLHCWDRGWEFRPEYLSSHERQWAEDLLADAFDEELEKEAEAAHAESRPRLVAIRGGAA